MTPEPAENKVNTGRSNLTVFASVKLTVVLLSLVATTILIGAWCPQETQVGQEKVIEEFGENLALSFHQWGITDIFHSPWFLLLIFALTINMVACSFQRVFPKLRLLKQPMRALPNESINRLPVHQNLFLGTTGDKSITMLAQRLKKMGYFVKLDGRRLTGEFGKFGRLAPTVTHIGLLTLLLGVTITSWTGFAGFQPVPLLGSLSFSDSEHSKLWVGKLPQWRVKVNQTWREDYPTGEAKQWYSDLSVIDNRERQVARKTISVNDPLSYEGVDIYQSSWGLDRLEVSFNGHKQALNLRPMGKLYAAFLPLDQTTILIFSARNTKDPLRVFAKTPHLQSPKMLAEIAPGSSRTLGQVVLKYEKVIPVTGLQYKSDPGLPLTYVAFGFIICGVLLAAVPHRQVWAEAKEENENGNLFSILTFGGTSMKAKKAFEKGMCRLAETLESELPANTNAQSLGDTTLCPT